MVFDKGLVLQPGGLGLTMLSPQPPDSWDNKYLSTHLVDLGLSKNIPISVISNLRLSRKGWLRVGYQSSDRVYLLSQTSKCSFLLWLRSKPHWIWWEIIYEKTKGLSFHCRPIFWWFCSLIHFIAETGYSSRIGPKDCLFIYLLTKPHIITCWPGTWGILGWL